MSTSETRKLYCSTCGKHTPHRRLIESYADQCTICYAQTNTLMRLTLPELASNVAAPDGTKAEVVEHTTREVVYYVPSGPYAGYYHYDKQTKQKRIEHKR